MLQSLAAFVKLAGYRGLVILFDEAEQAYSVMRRAALKDAQNNLLSLINNVQQLRGLLLLYATTPDFYTDPKHGITTYGALATRIGQPQDRPPRALDPIWNLDSVQLRQAEYQQAARKIHAVYQVAYGPAVAVPPPPELDEFVARLEAEHPSLASLRFWRVLVTGVVAHLDDALQGESRPVEEVYQDVLTRLRES